MSKLRKNKKVIIILIVIIICIISVLLFRSYYKIEDRISKLKKYDKLETKPLGWIRVQGTNIDMPVIYDDGMQNLTNPNVDLGWTYEETSKLQNRTVIMSHNVLNVSSKPLIGNKEHRRFEQLMAYIYYDFVKDNKYIQYTNNEGNYLYKIYGVSFQKQDEVGLKNISQHEKKTYIDYTKRQSYFNFDVEVNEKDKLITLVTCTRFFGDSDYSFVIDGRLMKENELIKNYKVTEKSKYKSIKKILKGDDNNE